MSDDMKRSLLLCFLTGIVSVLNVLYNGKTLFDIIKHKQFKKKEQIHLIYYRFYINIVASISAIIFVTYVGQLFYHDVINQESQNVLFWIGYISAQLSMARSFIALFLGITRIMAAIFPWIYKKINQAKLAVYLLIATCGLSFSMNLLPPLCSLKIEYVEECYLILCLLNPCMKRSILVLRLTTGIFITFCAITLLVKLCQSKIFAAKKNDKLKKINTLILTDISLMIVFYYLPVVFLLIANFASMNLANNSGPTTSFAEEMFTLIETKLSRMIWNNSNAPTRGSIVAVASQFHTVSRVQKTKTKSNDVNPF